MDNDKKVGDSIKFYKIFKEPAKHPKCKGYYDPFLGGHDCGYYSSLSCEECKYGCGRKDPEAKCNQEYL